MAKNKTGGKSIQTLTHDEAKRKNLPSAEYESLMRREEAAPPEIHYPRGVAGLEAEKAARDPDLDPQIVWRGKEAQDETDLVVPAPPLYIQEKVHPKALIDDLKRVTDAERRANDPQFDMFADFNGLPSEAARTEFYRHDANWSNRMILGDSLQVMCSLAEREGLRGKVQCIYLDPPYGIRFNSNFQWSTTSRDVKDGKREHITREPEQVKAFRDTWRDGIHSYLSYLRDRLIVARDLLTESGSIFVQIGDENVHRVRMVMDEVFGEGNFVVQITFQKTGGIEGNFLSNTIDYVLWYAKSREHAKYRRLLLPRRTGHTSLDRYDQYQDSEFLVRALTKDEKIDDSKLDLVKRYQLFPLYSDGESENASREFIYQGQIFSIRRGTHWKTAPNGLSHLAYANRIECAKNTIRYKRFVGDVPMLPLTDRWESTQIGTERIYVVQTASETIKRCLLMCTDPGDLVLDPTCGSGTTAYVAEQWGRRWITCDTSRVALALARARIMGARYPYYLLADSPEGLKKQMDLGHRPLVPIGDRPKTGGDIRQGFVYERVPHITLKAIANNTEIDTLWEKYQPTVLAILEALNGALRGHKQPLTVTTGGRAGQTIPFDAPAGETVKLPSGEEIPAHELLEWEVPREAPNHWPKTAKGPLTNFWEARMDRQRAMDKSIAGRADFESLYDKPFEDKGVARVAGPFTVESLSPHRVMGVDQGRAPEPPTAVEADGGQAADSVIITDGKEWGFVHMVMENLKTAGVQQASKDDRITFTAITGWPGYYVRAEGRYREGGDEDDGGTGPEKRAGIFIGPEFGTVSRSDLVAASREALDSGFEVLIACAFNFDAQSAEFTKLGPVPILKARMNADLHMAGDLKNTGQGNLFVVFGEPDVTVLEAGNDTGDDAKNHQIRVKVNGVDVFHPRTGEVRADGPEGIACWFVDTDYDEESFFVRQAYFLGAGDPYKALKTTLKAEISDAAWASLYGDTSRAFPRPKSGRVAVKVINHLGDEVMKVLRVNR
uniref:site-specific DNA-methyltransferase (adenine-specific) n=1 Tax=Candidatus Kentrum eta TaxID=2126337 RepID=A0A450UDP8_9GAMM|nr:MAG: adenine-specific DNA-methyltransferase [Candidatus Kentron sp. H]VFJ90560.1 MAG: adenine-specific DNA-methyltransferase [Candidatus Kentron sp. H]VFJ96708.1 MAG: adenine-specific DNA-methyltransferase [Candidatus Kentron sp. H]